MLSVSHLYFVEFFMRNVIAATAALIVSATVAYADDLNRWSGWDVGGFAGKWWVNANYCDFLSKCASNQFDPWVGGAMVTYDHEFANRFVLGARLSAVLASSAQTHDVPPPVAAAGETIKATSQWEGSADLIAGYDIDGHFMPYVGLGYAVENDKITVNIPGVGTNDTQATHNGVEFITGLNVAVDRHWDVGIAYVYDKFDTQHYQSGPPLGVNDQGSFTTNSLLGTIGYKF